MALERESEIYRNHLQELLAETGRYVLIHRDEVCGTYAAYEDAIEQGYQRFGLDDFLVKQILATEIVQHVMRTPSANLSAVLA